MIEKMFQFDNETTKIDETRIRRFFTLFTVLNRTKCIFFFMRQDPGISRGKAEVTLVSVNGPVALLAASLRKRF